MMKRCPACSEWYPIEDNEVDYVHDCFGSSDDETVKYEDVARIEDSYEDDDGTTKLIPNQSVTPAADINQGTDAGFEGRKDFDRTDRGNNAKTCIPRKRKTYIEF